MDQRGPDDGAEAVEVQPVEQQDGLEHGVDEHADADVREGEVAAGAGADVDVDVDAGVLGVHEYEDEHEGAVELETEE